jgi:hypothetical protein
MVKRTEDRKAEIQTTLSTSKPDNMEKFVQNYLKKYKEVLKYKHNEQHILVLFVPPQKEVIQRLRHDLHIYFNFKSVMTIYTIEQWNFMEDMF